MTHLDPDATSLIELARSGDDPVPEDRIRVRGSLIAALGAGAATATVATGTAAEMGVAAGGPGALGSAAGVGAFGAAKLASWIGVGLLAGVATSGALFMVDARKDDPLPGAPRASALQSPGTPDLAAPVVAETPVPVAEDPPIALAPVKERPGSAEDREPAGGAAPGASLGAETRLLEEARRAHGAGDPGRALELLDDHARRFPSGALGEERGASRVLALCALGRTAEARRAADAFVRAAPRSPLRARVQGSCGGR